MRGYPSIRLSSVYLVNQLSLVDRINQAQVKLKLLRLSLGVLTGLDTTKTSLELNTTLNSVFNCQSSCSAT